jgi:hypothetical protein
MIVTTEEHHRIGYCECGARLAGGSVRELFDAAERHIARDHPTWVPERRASSLASLVPRWEPPEVGAATGATS